MSPHVPAIFDIWDHPYAFNVRIANTDGSFTDVILHLMVSAAHVTIQLPLCVVIFAEFC